MAFGDQQIEWLTEEEIGVFDYFTKIMSYSGTFTRNKRTQVCSVIFWSGVYIPMTFVLLNTAVYYIDDFDLLAYTLHHLVLLCDAYILSVVVVSTNCQQFFYVMDEAKNTYNYDSDLVNNYAREIIRKRIELSRLVAKLISFGSIGIIVEVQLFFAIEAYWFKTYKTVFPVYIGLDLGDPLVFVSVVIWQELIVYYTTYLPLILSATIYSAWSHLDLEMKILTFAVANVQNIVEEKSRKPVLKGGDDRKISEIYESYCYHFAKHHATIISYFNAFSQAVWWVTPLLFTTGFILFVTVGLATMSDNLGIKLKLFWFLVIQLVVTYFWCFISQYIGDKSEEISQAVVSAPWWLMPKSCHSTLLLIMTRCRNPLMLTTPYGTQANMESFMDMLKSVYQFISVVYQMKND